MGLDAERELTAQRKAIVPLRNVAELGQGLWSRVVGAASLVE